MKTDFYTKFILTVIAIALVGHLAISTRDSSIDEPSSDTSLIEEPQKIQLCFKRHEVWKCGIAPIKVKQWTKNDNSNWPDAPYLNPP